MGQWTYKVIQKDFSETFVQYLPKPPKGKLTPGISPKDIRGKDLAWYAIQRYRLDNGHEIPDKISLSRYKSIDYANAVVLNLIGGATFL